MRNSGCQPFTLIRLAGAAALLLVAACSRGESGGDAQSRAPRGMMGDMPMMAGRGGMRYGPADTAAAPRGAARDATAPGCPPASQEVVDAGRRLFTGAGNCYACHGSDARGTAAAPDLTDSAWLNVDGSYAAIENLVRTGVPRPKQHPAPMPAQGGAQLDGAQTCAVAAYVSSLSRRRSRGVHP